MGSSPIGGSKCFAELSYWVYILYSESISSYYKGQTRDLDNRLFRHNNGYEKSTKNGRPWRLVWKTEKNDRSEASILERKLKNMSRQKLLDFINKSSKQVVGSGDSATTGRT